MQFDPIMTDATTRFFKRSTDLQLSRDFASKPELMDDVIEALLRFRLGVDRPGAWNDRFGNGRADDHGGGGKRHYANCQAQD
jgi:hypothetical protein